MSLSGYDYTLNSRCIAILLDAGEKAERLEWFFLQLAAAPSRQGDYQETQRVRAAVWSLEFGVPG